MEQVQAHILPGAQPRPQVKMYLVLTSLQVVVVEMNQMELLLEWQVAEMAQPTLAAEVMVKVTVNQVLLF